MDSPITLFNWIQRYLVQPQDLTQLQTSLIDNANAGWEGVGKAAVLDGFVPSFTGGLNVSLTPGIAVGPTGYFMGVTGTTAVTIASPSGNPCRTLIVARPLVTQSNPIANPIPPVETVYLNEDFGAQIVVLNGTPAAAPAYPATTYGDVILAGFRLPASASSLTEDNLDYSIKDALGKNAHGLKAVARWDQRCLVLPTGANTVSISPSQPTYANPPGVTYGGGARPLIFPRTSGVFTPSLTNLNFTTGGVSGGDGDSGNFTPTIPSAGNFIWAVVTLSTTSLLSVAYGTTGTYAQCKAGFRSQTATGAGSVPTTGAAKIAYVLVGSSDGVNITELEVVDARGPGNVATSVSQAITVVNSGNTPYTMTGTENRLQIDATGGNIVVNLPDRASNLGTNYPVDRIDGSSNTVSINRAGSDTFAEPVNTTSYPFAAYESQDIFAGTTKWKVRG